MTSSLLRLAACLLISSVAHAESYQGAPSLLERLQQPAPDEPSATDAQALKPRLEAFKREAAKLEPQAAAKRWLALFEDFASTSDDSESDEEAAELSDLLEALPPSTAWPELEKEIAATKEGRPSARHTALRVLMAALNGSTDVPALVAEVNAEMKRGRGFLNRYSSYEAQQGRRGGRGLESTQRPGDRSRHSHERAREKRASEPIIGTPRRSRAFAGS